MILGREPQTEFEELGTHFIATFKRNSYELTNPAGFGENVGDTTQKTSEKTSEKILSAIKTDTTLSARQLAEILGLSPRAIEFQLSQLRKKGVLIRVGPDKGGYWEVVSNSA
jgi:ATP-dependent DNA helicase RecG